MVQHGPRGTVVPLARIAAASGDPDGALSELEAGVRAGLEPGMPERDGAPRVLAPAPGVCEIDRKVESLSRRP